MEDQICDVVIIGGGLVGSLCACFMGKRGYSVMLFEKREDIRCAKLARGRSINLAMSNRARRSLREIGMEEEILKSAIPMMGRLVHSTTGSTKSIPYDSSNNQCIYSVSRNLLNSELLNATRRYPTVRLHFDHKLISTDLEKGISVLKNTKDGSTVTVKSNLIIGADGAFSSVRKAMQTMPLFTFSQTYIEHGYLELSILPEKSKYMIPNHLHIWPRGSFMMIALPNNDESWTVTLFMPFDRFKSLDTPRKLVDFFEQTFPDSLPLIGRDRLVQDFFKSSPSSLVSIKCSSYHYGKAVLIGDAAHAMVPFYGQGMNAGFEDCLILDRLFTQFDGSVPEVLEGFTRVRKDDAHAICDLAMYNYVEMRDLVNKTSYHLRKKVDDLLYKMMPDTWIPLYNSVTFSNMGYKKCMENRRWQDNVFKNSFLFAIAVFPIAFGYSSLANMIA